MSWTVNGVTWTPQSAATHAQTQLNYLNSLAITPQLTASPTNAIWLNFLGSGSLQQNYDAELYAASQSFNVATCDDNQVLNLAPVTGTSPLPATYSSALVNVTASSSGSATVTAGTKIPFQSINFVVTITTVIPASTTASVFTVADTTGPYLALAGQLNAFSSSVTNVASVTNPGNSSQGSNSETTQAFRQRLINGNGTVNWDLDGTILAIRALPGVVAANVYFNVSTVNNLTLPGAVVIPPRYASIVIQGSDVSGQLPLTYAKRMTAPTQGAYSGNWTSLSGQVIPIYYNSATTQSVYVKVYYDTSQTYQPGFDVLIQNAIVGLNGALTIGQAVTSQLVSSVLDNFNYATITGITVSIDNATFSRNAVVNAYQVGYFSTGNISVLSGP